MSTSVTRKLHAIQRRSIRSMRMCKQCRIKVLRGHRCPK